MHVTLYNDLTFFFFFFIYFFFFYWTAGLLDKTVHNKQKQIILHMGLSDLHCNQCLSNGTAQTGPGTANAHNCRPQQREAQFASQPSHHYSVGKTVLCTQKVGQSLIKLSSSITHSTSSGKN